MTNLKTLSVAQLSEAIDIKEQIDKLEHQLEFLMGGDKRGPGRPAGKRTLSAAAKARISAGMKAKWAQRLGKDKPVKKRKMSAAGRAAIAAAQKARWAKVKVGKK